ncbi:hypothetical protein HYH03_006599 [Edaphochlamys debaryana]|uniref:Uncharacterized protein n=1 Tax=Edaphochlamys debaryana TaxID=47281 RepID=A0A835Y558_9CHLO|nr:hypothetical protein HYH03_006599 [Edaphochlamys debaryana]|eukprot:KAG2495329.1 hypothetical protein HYH03_006599 [Edaphochlamys debaryana]
MEVHISGQSLGPKAEPSEASSLSCEASGPFTRLPLELVERVGAWLPSNEKATSLRLVCRTLAARFRGHTIIHLSQPVLPELFAAHWGATGSCRCLPLRRRRQLVCLVAASGVTANLRVAAAAAGCVPGPEALESAAAAGQPECCLWLMTVGGVEPSASRPPSNSGASSGNGSGGGGGGGGGGALAAAAGSGQRAMCEWLLAARGVPWSEAAVQAAARGGHEETLAYLLSHQPPHHRLNARGLLTAAAAGLPLHALVRLHRMLEHAPHGSGNGGNGHGGNGHSNGIGYGGGGGGGHEGGNGSGNGTAARARFLGDGAAGSHGHAPPPPPSHGRGRRMGLAASLLGSPSPLRRRPQRPAAAALAAPAAGSVSVGGMEVMSARDWSLVLAAAAGSSSPDWADKVNWLEGATGAALTAAAVTEAAGTPDDADASVRLRWLLAERCAPADRRCLTAAAAAGNTSALALLSAAVGPPGPAAAAAAAAAGHLDTLQYIAEAAEPPSGGGGAAADGGGGGWDPDACLLAAVAGGHEAMVDWLLDQRPPDRPLSGRVFAAAAAAGDVGLLRRLQGAAGPRGAWALRPTFDAAADAGSEAAMRWLAEAGCRIRSDGELYVRAARRGDLATIRALACLGCGWGSGTFERCVFEPRAGGSGAGNGGGGGGDGGVGAPLAALALLATMGCPVDVRAALAAARRREGGDGEEVAAWLAGEEFLATAAGPGRSEGGAGGGRAEGGGGGRRGRSWRGGCGCGCAGGLRVGVGGMLLRLLQGRRSGSGVGGRGGGRGADRAGTRV